MQILNTVKDNIYIAVRNTDFVLTTMKTTDEN